MVTGDARAARYHIHGHGITRANSIPIPHPFPSRETDGANTRSMGISPIRALHKLPAHRSAPAARSLYCI